MRKATENDERIRLLKWFDEPFDVDVACFHEFGIKDYWPAQHILAVAKSESLIVTVDDSPAIVNSPGVYQCRCILTDAGRRLCGLKELGVNPVSKVTQKSLFDE